MLRVCLIGIALVLVPNSRGSADDKSSEYTFTINGQPITPAFIHLEGSSERPASGDLVAVFDYLLKLGKERTQAFLQLELDDGILWSEALGKPRQPVAVTVSWKFTNERDDTGQYKRVITNPFTKLTKEDIKCLRCVSLEGWSDDLPAALSQLDPRRVCMIVSGDAVVAPDRSLAPLPEGLQYLSIRENNNVFGIKDYRPLSKLTQLKYLSVNTMVSPFDCDVIRGAKKLTHLKLHARAISNLEKLAEVTALRQLDVSRNREIKDIGFAAKLAALQSLDLTSTAVVDLSALNGHSSLQRIEAPFAPVAKLPTDKPMRKLIVLDVLSTKVSDTESARFKKLNPESKLITRWDRKLAEALSGATAIRVRTGGTCHL